MDEWDTEDVRWVRTARETFRFREVGLVERSEADKSGQLQVLFDARGAETGDRSMALLAATLSVGRRYAVKDYVIKTGRDGLFLWRPLGEDACVKIGGADLERMMIARQKKLLAQLRERPEVCTRCGGKLETGALVYTRLWADKQWICYCESCHAKSGSPQMELVVFARPSDWGPKISSAALKRMIATQMRLEEILAHQEKSLS